MDVWRPFRRPFRDLHFASAKASSKQELPRSRFFYDFSRSASAVTPGASAKTFSRGCVEVCYLYLLVGRAFWRCFWLYWLASQKHTLYQSNTFRFRTSQMAHTCDILGWVNQFSWSYLPYRWARGLSMPLRERFASAKLPQRTWTLLPKTYQDHGHLVFTTAHVKQIANTLHRIKRSMSICIYIYTISLCDAHMKCKRQNPQILQNTLPRNFNIKKTWKLLPRASATAVRCKFLIHMSKSCVANMTALKTETQLSFSGFRVYQQYRNSIKGATGCQSFLKQKPTRFSIISAD